MYPKLYSFRADLAKDQECSASFIKFADIVQKELNQDADLISTAKQVNIDFSKKVKEIVGDEENIDFCGNRLMLLLQELPRYHTMDGFEFQGKIYNIRIDLLTWCFELIGTKYFVVQRMTLCHPFFYFITFNSSFLKFLLLAIFVILVRLFF